MQVFTIPGPLHIYIIPCNVRKNIKQVIQIFFTFIQALEIEIKSPAKFLA